MLRQEFAMRLLVLLVVCLPSLANGEIYRWTDASGQVHFSDRPVAGSAPVEVEPQVIERDADTIEREARSERFFSARREEQEVRQAREAERLTELRSSCNIDRERLAQLQQAGRFYREDADGTRVYYSDAELEQARSQLSNRLSAECQ